MPSRTMHLISWNVAGLGTTVNRIHGHNTKQKDAFSKFLKKHGSPDILCLQEHKIPLQQLSSRAEPHRCADLPGYDSFWSCCTDPNRKGMNGVVTYVKTGLTTQADCQPLDIAELNQQGRCVLTRHGKRFSLWNVYAPASENGAVVQLTFLRALSRAIERERERSGAPQILVGDLNLRHDKQDVHWKERVVYVDEVIKKVKGATTEEEEDEVAPWMEQVAQYWSTIEEALATQTVIETTTTNPTTKEKFQKYRLQVTSKTGKPVMLGKHEVSQNYCFHGYDFSTPCTYRDPDTGEDDIAIETNAVKVRILAELMAKLARVEWDEETQRDISRSYGEAPRSSPSRAWMTKLLRDGKGMIDVFRYLYPDAAGRFTCWNQSTNRRYYNEGVRLDYTVIDRSLAQYIDRGAPLRCGPNAERLMLNPNSEEASLRASTANGLFEPVSYEGGGMMSMSRVAFDSQFEDIGTGMIYTPPNLSDHIAISLLLDTALWNEVVGTMVLQVDAATKKAQPHKKQRSIDSFFGVATSSSSVSVNPKRPSPSKTSASANKKPKKGSILSHFARIKPPT